MWYETDWSITENRDKYVKVDETNSLHLRRCPVTFLFNYSIIIIIESNVKSFQIYNIVF